MSRRRSAEPSSVVSSSVTSRLLRFVPANTPPRSYQSGPRSGTAPENRNPSGRRVDSTFTTSAPSAPRYIVQYGPAQNVPRSSTLSPAKGSPGPAVGAGPAGRGSGG